MKKIKFIYVLIATLLFFNSSCDRLKTEAQYQGVSLYKTRGDYYDKVTVGIKKNENRIFRTPYVSGGALTYTGTDTIPKSRAKLVNGYILDSEADLNYDAFLSMSYKELLLWEEKYGETSFIIDTAWKYILDKDPYIEFYKVKNSNMFVSDTSHCDTTGLNQIILEGKIEEYFTKLK
jgi:hypothetical protein